MGKSPALSCPGDLHSRPARLGESHLRNDGGALWNMRGIARCPHDRAGASQGA